MAAVRAWALDVRRASSVPPFTASDLRRPDLLADDFGDRLGVGLGQIHDEDLLRTGRRLSICGEVAQRWNGPQEDGSLPR